jgi:uridine phosphorylase
VSIIDTFDDTSEEIIKPSSLEGQVNDFPEVVVVAFNEKIHKLVQKMPGAIQISDMDAGYTIPIYKINYQGKNVAFYQTILGGAASVGLLEEVIAKGGKKFVFFGSCGTLDKDLSAGHLIVPVAAYRDEGTSYHYAPVGDYIEVETAERLAEVLSEINIPYVKGKTWTTDAFYRETRKNMKARKEDGCITVEMECASIMAASQFRNVKLYQYLYTEDNLDSETWDPRTMGKVPKSAIEKYLRIALEIAIRV